jgi:hypothetical protein
MTTHPLQYALAYLEEAIRLRLQEAFPPETGAELRPTLTDEPFRWEGHFRALLPEGNLTDDELLTLLMALAPEVEPNFYDRVFQAYLPGAGDFPQLGGWRGKQHRGFLPTGDTVLFLLAGEDTERRIQARSLFSEAHWFYQKRLLYLDLPPEGEPPMSGKLTLGNDVFDLLTQGRAATPRFSLQFPAQRIHTEMEWDDLVLNPHTLRQIKELESWVLHGETLLKTWGMGRKLKRGYRALFYGPPGTGKTLTASLLGKHTHREVFKVDLSMVVSKFIGETEKNLANLFARAENKGWILFFDEADALFGKRTNVRDAHDKYANQEVSYLLQRVETYDGLVILASNFKSNIDDAFLRRFQAIIHFPLPSPQERETLWRQSFPARATLAEDVDLLGLARRYELTGADIMNVVQHCCLGALARGDQSISLADLRQGIERELAKFGKLA